MFFHTSARAESERDDLTSRSADLEALKRQAAADRAEVDLLRGKLADMQVRLMRACVPVCVYVYDMNM